MASAVAVSPDLVLASTALICLRFPIAPTSRYQCMSHEFMCSSAQVDAGGCVDLVVMLI